MIKYLTEALVALNIDGQKKTFLNSEKNIEQLKTLLPKEELEKILSVWGNKSFIENETPLQGKQLIAAQNKVIDKMKEKCTNTIVKGIEYDGEKYSFEITDQLNLSRLANQAKEGKERVIYHANGKTCRLYSAQEIINLNDAMENFIEYHTTYFNGLKDYIKSLNYQSEIAKVYYGMSIPSIILQTLIEQ